MTDTLAADEAVYAALKAMNDPVECARQITAMSKARGNLSGRLARLRIARLIEARVRDGRKVTWLATQIGLGPSGISRLTSPSHPAYPLSEGVSS